MRERETETERVRERMRVFAMPTRGKRGSLWSVRDNTSTTAAAAATLSFVLTPKISFLELAVDKRVFKTNWTKS